jgi:hypothetical protein
MLNKFFSNKLYQLKFALLIFLFLLITHNTYLLTPTFADSYHFNDEFNDNLAANSLDSSKWTYYANTGASFTSIQESDGSLVTKQQNFSTEYPLIVSNNGLPEGDFSSEIKFQYTKITSWGTGIALSEEKPVNGGGFSTLLAIGVWQDNSAANLRIGFNGQDVYKTPINTSSHTFKVDRTGQKYLVYLDNNLVYTSPDTDSQVKYIWMGNPGFFTGGIPEWTTFNVDYVRVTTPPPAATPTPSPTPTPQTTKTPLIFIPGIGGSELKTASEVNWSQDNGHGGTYTNTYHSGDKVWVNEPEAARPGNDDYFDILKIKPDGQTPEADLGLTGGLYPRAYQPTIDYFKSNGYTLNKDFFVFPYDWRKDLSLTSTLLDLKINSIKTQTGSSKVDIVTHSMGGLVARNYISDPLNSPKVRKLVELGTPHLGSVEIIKMLHYGDCLNALPIQTGSVCLGVSKSEIKDVVQNFTGIFDLAPTKSYYSFYSGEDNSHPFPFRDNSDIDGNNQTGPLNYDQTKTLLSNLEHNTTLFTPSENFHNIDNNLSNTNGVDVTLVAGSGVGTIGQIVETNLVDIAGIKLPKKDILLINGDKTVPLYSASLNDAIKNISLKGTSPVYYVNAKHEDLPVTDSVLDLIKNILNGDSKIPNGISDQPINLKGTSISIHSPVDLNIYDSNGKHTGPTSDGGFEEQIPGSVYQTLDDAKFIWLPEEGHYSVKLNATDLGSFDFKIRSYANDSNFQTVLFKTIPINNTTKAEAEIDTSSTQNTVLQIDKDGDGTVDSQKNPDSVLDGDANYDFTSPAILLNTPTKNAIFILNQAIKADFQCTDLESGIDKCIGTVSNAASIDTQSVGNKQFTVYAEDKAGNANLQLNDYKVQYTKDGLCFGEQGHLVLQPINSGGTSTFKQGSTVPIKFRVCDFNGSSIGNKGAVSGFNISKIVSGTVTNEVNEAVLSTNSDSSFRWDPTSQQWIFNLSTKNLSSGKTYFYKINLNDGSTIEFSFGLK